MFDSKANRTRSPEWNVLAGSASRSLAPCVSMNRYFSPGFTGSPGAAAEYICFAVAASALGGGGPAFFARPGAGTGAATAGGDATVDGAGTLGGGFTAGVDVAGGEATGGVVGVVAGWDNGVGC